MVFPLNLYYLLIRKPRKSTKNNIKTRFKNIFINFYGFKEVLKNFPSELCNWFGGRAIQFRIKKGFFDYCLRSLFSFFMDIGGVGLFNTLF